MGRREGRLWEEEKEGCGETRRKAVGRREGRLWKEEKEGCGKKRRKAVHVGDWQKKWRRRTEKRKTDCVWRFGAAAIFKQLSSFLVLTLIPFYESYNCKIKKQIEYEIDMIRVNRRGTFQNHLIHVAVQ